MHTIYKKSLNVYEASDENMVRSIAVYCSGCIVYLENKSIVRYTGGGQKKVAIIENMVNVV